MPTEPPESPALVESLARGPLIGTFIGLILYGFTCLQAFIYFQTYPRDRRGLKITVAFLIILETVHAALTMHVMDYYLVAKYGDIQVLEAGTWSFTFTYIIGLLIDFIVYIYFTWRIWMFTRKKWIVIFMSFISVSRTATSVVPSVWSPSWITYLGTARNITIAGNSLFILGDTFSAAIMAYHLRKNRIGNHRTDRLINRLVIFAAATGTLNS
ncbi:hypothetical protein F5I97DRAFT_404340 [Phlebopus sp. FC_14]|nr:hypothetical protein F5I97DRAFT_404340 [Phlebopus sp. FC_14]